ncbi:hypothetical protein HYY75_11480, partial [bacterium]|nr:hypothetical protein [bacterium]
EIASIIIGELATLAGKKDARQIAAQLSLGLQENVTIGLHEKLEELVKVLKENGDLSSEETDSARFQIISDKGKNEVSKFLRQFGHLTCSWDIMQPTWGEDRDEFFAFLNHRVKVTSGMRAGVTKFESNESSFLNSLEANPFAVDLAKKLISILRKFVKIDDEHHFHTARVIPPTRSLVRKLGRFLAQKALIEKADDIFWLTDQEVRDLLADEAKKPQIRLVEARKISFQNAISEGPPDENFERKSCENSNIMAGLGVSGGVGRGFVRPVSNFQDLSKIQKGDVMVTTSPDPFFAIVYPQITALVAETGALLSHGAVLAREYNLPAVFGVTKACERLIPGTLVEVNGDTGFVCVIEKKFPQ